MADPGLDAVVTPHPLNVGAPHESLGSEPLEHPMKRGPEIAIWVRLARQRRRSAELHCDVGMAREGKQLVQTPERRVVRLLERRLSQSEMVDNKRQTRMGLGDPAHYGQGSAHEQAERHRMRLGGCEETVELGGLQPLEHCGAGGNHHPEADNPRLVGDLGNEVFNRGVAIVVFLEGCQTAWKVRDSCVGIGRPRRAENRPLDSGSIHGGDGQLYRERDAGLVIKRPLPGGHRFVKLRVEDLHGFSVTLRSSPSGHERVFYSNVKRVAVVPKPIARKRGVVLEFGGLDLSRPDELTPQEGAAFSEFYRRRFDHLHEGLEFMLTERSDALKRFRLFVRVGYETGDPARTFNLGFFIYYAYTGYETGVRYTIRSRQHQGMTRTQCMDAIALAFLRVGPAGAQTISRALADYTWLEPKPALQPPEAWGGGAGLLRSGLDFGTPELSEEERDRLLEWHRSVLGEIPPHVAFLARHHPDALKAYRNRVEHALKVLPAQCLPLSFLTFDALRGSSHGVRENLLLCKAFGIDKDTVVQAIVAGMEYGGADNVDAVAGTAEDVLAGWS